MTDILKNWITNRLGVVLEFSPDVIGRNIRDGRIIANLLYSYNIISRNQLRVIIPTDDVYAARANLKHIAAWIRCLHLACDESLYEEVASARSSAAIHLLYQLFLALNKLCYPTLPIRDADESTRFNVTQVDEDQLTGNMFTANPLAGPLLNRKDLINWYRNKYQQMDAQIVAQREKFRQLHAPKPPSHDIRSHPKLKPHERERKCYEEYCEMIRKFEEKHPSDTKDYTFEELFKMLTTATEYKCDPSKAESILQHIKMKFRNQVAQRKYKSKLEKMLTHELWENILQKQEEEFNKDVAEKTLKQSDFEKQMMTKCFEVRNQKRIITENRLFIANLLEKKREDEFSKAVLEHNEQVSREQIRYSQERERQLELHKRLYCEKVCRQHEEDCEFCLQIVKGYVDFAIRVGEYHKLYSEEVPKRLLRDWTILIRKQQPLFPFIPKEAEAISATPGPVEELVLREHERQTIMNENDVDEYLQLQGQWRLDDLFDDEDFPDIPHENGFRVLAHVVQRLLMFKYPLPAPLQPPELPPFKIRSCVVGIKDFTIIPTLRELLEYQNIVLLDIEHAINYCLKQFQDDMLGLQDVQIRFLEESVYAVDPELFPTDVQMVADVKSGESIPIDRDEKPESPPDPKASAKGGKGSDKKGGKGSDKKGGKESAAPADKQEQADKKTQTPKVLPEDFDSESLSEAAYLGKCAYELLNIGKPLTDFVTGAMLVAYLKTLSNADGWVLFNYPTTAEQTNVLEMVLTGDNPSIEGESVDELFTAPSSFFFQDSIENIPDTMDLNRSRRVSNIVGKPYISLDSEEHDTYLTSYITAQMDSSSDGNRDLIDEYTEPTSPVDLFYTEQGVRYIYRYKVFDFNSIVQLAKLIIGDFVLPQKTSEELFGPAYNELKEQYDPSVITEGLPSTTKALIESDISVNFEEADYEGYEIEPYEIQPGDPDWMYVMLPVNQMIASGAATVWENMEITYLADIRELLAIKRNHRNTIVPYVTHVKNHIRDFKSRPDEKQTVLQEFQFMYNNITDDLRDDVEVKAELHCRIDELRKQLWAISDERMEQCENERQQLINDNWITEQMIYLTNQFITMLQLELNRCVDTLQTVQDYYLTMLGVPISATDTLVKTDLPKIDILVKPVPQVTESGTELPIIYNPNDPKEYTQEGIAINKQIADIFTKQEEVSLDATDFVKYIQNAQEATTRQVNDWETIVRKVLSDNSQPAAPPKKGKGTEEPTIDPNERERALKEWSAAIVGEIERMHLRIPVTERKAISDINEIFECGQTTFHTVYDDISTQYEREIQAINQVCELFGRAVEDEKKIQFELVLNDDKFYVCGDTKLYEDQPPSKTPSLHERIPDGEFSVPQLRKLYDIFFDLAPNGSIPERVLTFVLQDLLFLDTDDGYHQDFPVLWTHLNTLQLTKVIDDLFGDPEFIDWRDFLIYNMGIPFPNEKQMLKAWMTYALYDDRKEEVVNRKYYNYVRLWFEKDAKPSEPEVVSTHVTISDGDPELPDVEYADEEELLRIQLLKELLFDLFETKDGYVNYTGLLLAFCKDVNPTLGLVKALSLALKSLIGWDPVEGGKQEERDRDQYLRGGKNVVEEEESRSTLEDYNCVCGDITIVDEDDNRSSPYLQSSASSTPNLSGINEPLNQLFVDQPKWRRTDEEEMHGESRGRSFISLALAHMYSDEELRMYHERAYLLPFQAAFLTLGAALPWHIRTQCLDNNTLREMLQRVFTDLRQSHIAPNNVYIYKFLQHPIIRELLGVCNKFADIYPPKIIKKYVGN